MFGRRRAWRRGFDAGWAAASEFLLGDSGHPVGEAVPPPAKSPPPPRVTSK